MRALQPQESASREEARQAGRDEGGSAAEITLLLRAWADREPAAGDRLFDLVYPELRRLARRQLARERAGISIQATEVIHEAYLKLMDQRHCTWQCRAQFFALAATLIRRILIDHAKHRRRRKRGLGAVHLSLEEVQLPGVPAELDVVDLDQALVELAGIEMAASRIVELRYFAGLSLDETASVTQLSRSTVQRKWRFAKAWLARKMEVG